MAWNISRIYGQLPRILCIQTLFRSPMLFHSKLEVDVLDDFTSQLMQKKISKWDLQKRKNEAMLENAPKSEEKRNENIQIESVSDEQLAFMFQNALDNFDNKTVISLIRLCVHHNKLPPFTLLLNVLSICAQTGDKEIVCSIQHLCTQLHPQTAAANSNFQHFVAEATWVRGDIGKALDIFEDVYRSNAYLRRRIRLMLKNLIPDLVPNRSEAALRNLIQFSERILRDFQDCCPLTNVWQACFLSEWFTDQCLALELLETHNCLSKAVVSKIPYVVFVSLKCHRTEVVYRLLELLLKYRMLHQISNVLPNLLHYQFRTGDLHGCAEVIKWAFDNNVMLPKNEYIATISLLVSDKTKKSLVPLQPNPPSKPKYCFKF